MACSSGCTTGPHESWGACVRDKGLSAAVSIPGNDYDRGKQKAWDSELDLYRSARRQGIQPDSTKRDSIERAIKISDKTGVAFDAGAS